MRERSTWSREVIANQLRRVAEDPRAMNQDHLQQQPAADAYVIGGPSEFAEDLSNPGPGWKADLGSDGNTKRNEIGMPELRKDTFGSPEKAPGVSPSRQASVEEVYAKADVASKVARLMLSKTASEASIEDQALSLMNLPLSNLQDTLTRLAEDQGGADDDDDGDDDEGQQKQAQDQADDGDDDEGQQKQAKDLPPEFLKNIQEKKDQAKDKKDDDKKDDKKEASSRRKAQQQQDDGDDDQQSKQARRVKAQDDDEKKQSQQDEKKQSQQDEKKQASRKLKAQQQADDGDDDGQQQKQAKSKAAQQQQDDGDDQQKQAADQGQEDEEQVGKEAYALIKQAASDLLGLPQTARAATFKIVLPSLAKAAAYGMQQQSQDQQQVAMDQVMSQVQQMVQQAMQQQMAQGQQQQQPMAQGQQQQPMLADDALIDQMLQDPGQIQEDQIQLDAPDMDMGLGVYASDEDQALQAIFASDPEVQRAKEALSIEAGHHAPTHQGRTASTRSVGTRPTAGVSQLGGSSAGVSSGAEEISRLSSMWTSAPDVSNVFRS